MQPGTLVAGKYRVERVIGRGGMGLVVEATHLQLGHKVALKFLAEEMAQEQTAVARFNREARACAQLKNEHICRVTDFGVEGKAPYIVMELLSGTDLARLSKVRILDVPTAALFIKQACAGLAEAHAAGIIHRDLKPGNLFLTRRPDGSPLIKILDFGVAKAPAGENEVKLTGTSNVVGSPGFMSPEQFRSSKTVDGRTDIWALGIILYKLVSGRLPFKADGFAEFALAISRDEMPPLPEAAPAFAGIVARCLEKDPARRYPDVLSLADALAPFASSARPSAQQMTVPPSEPVDITGIGGMDGPDTNNHTQLLAGAAPVPKPAIAKVPALVKVPAPAGVAVIAPVHATAPRPAVVPPPAAKAAPPVARTMLGVTGIHESDPALFVPPVAAPALKPTLAETAIGAGETVAGTAVGAPPKPHGVHGELRPGMQVSEYIIDKKIGQGGMGVVYAATHPMIGKRCAIKVIGANLGADDVVVQRFIQEARSVNQIGHPNIIDVFSFGQLPDGRNYFVMDYLDGESLRARLYRSFMSIPDAIQILDEVVSALEAAHEKGIVHRDLKPDNVFLSSVRGGFTKVTVLDFGIAKLVTNNGVGIHKTSTGEMVGTPAYLSPEQARGRNVDYRTDIYALGVMMYEMITGRIPFIAEAAMDIVMMHISTPPTKPSTYKPDIPVLLEQTIMEMLAKDPDQRPTLTHIRNVFAELVASGQVQLEAGSTATFRSDLKSRPASSPRNQLARAPTPQPAAAPEAAQPQDSLVRRRASTPTDAPTAIQFVPGLETLVPSDNAKTRIADAVTPKKSRVGLVVAILLLVAVAAGITALVVLDPGGKKKASDAPVAAVADAGITTPAVVDASVAVVAADAHVEQAATIDAAAVAATRDVEIKVDAAGAKVEVDGAIVDVRGGVAKVSLADGVHRVVVSAPRRVTFTSALDVSEHTHTLDVKLDKARTGSTTTTTSRNTGSGSTTTTTTTPTGQGSGSNKYNKDGTIDPF